MPPPSRYRQLIDRVYSANVRGFDGVDVVAIHSDRLPDARPVGRSAHTAHPEAVGEVGAKGVRSATRPLRLESRFGSRT